MHQVRMSVGIMMTVLMLLSSSGVHAQMQEAASTPVPETGEVVAAVEETPVAPEATEAPGPTEPTAPPVEEATEPATEATEAVPADPVDEGDQPTGPPAEEEPVSEPATVEEPVVDEQIIEDDAPPAEDAPASAPVQDDVDPTPEASRSASSQAGPTTQSTGVSLTSGDDPWQDETLTVTVLDPDGNPLPRALVTVRNTDWMLSGEGVTDTNGVVVVRDLGGASRYEISVSADGGLWGEGSVANNETNQMAVTIRMVGAGDELPDSGSIALEALHFTSGEFARDATYYIYDASGALVYTVVGETGHYTTYLDDIPAGFYTVVVTSAEFGTGYGQFFVPQDGTVTVLFRDRAPISYTLTVSDAENGNPIPNADVTIHGGNGDQMASGATNADGVMSTSLLNKGYAYEEYSVSVSHASYLPASQVFTIDDPAQPKTMGIALEPVPPTTITVVDEDANGVPDAAVIVIRAGGGDPIRGYTDADGNLPITSLAEGNYTVTVTKDGYETGNTTFTYPTQGAVIIHLVQEDEASAVSFTVVVHDARTGEPIEGATLIAVDQHQQFVTQGITGPDGSWTIRNDGTAHEVLIRAVGYMDWNVGVPSPGSGIESRSVPLYQLVMGVLVDDVTGEPIANAEITLWEPGSAATRYVTTADDGRFSFIFNPYPHGEVIRFRARLSPAYETTMFDITMNSAAPLIELRLPPRTQENDGPGSAINHGTLTTSFTLCANVDCAAPHDTSLDGSAVTWTVTAEAGSAFVLPGTMALASAGSGGTGMTLQAQAADQHTVTAVLEGGLAIGSLELPIGSYRVCLQPDLTGANGSTIPLADEAACDTVRLTGDGVIGGPLAFRAMVDGSVITLPNVQEQDGSPGTDAPATDAEVEITEPTGVTNDTGDAATAGSSVQVSALPSAGSGAAASTTSWWLIASAMALFFTAIGLRQRGRV